MIEHLGPKSIDLITNNPLRSRGSKRKGCGAPPHSVSLGEQPHNLGYLRPSGSGAVT